MKPDHKKLLLFLLEAGVAFRRKGLLGFFLAPVLLEPFINPIFAAFRKEHEDFLQENFPEYAQKPKQDLPEDRPLH